MLDPLVLKKITQVYCVFVVSALFLFLPSGLLASSPTESELERLSRAYVEEPDQNSKEKLLSFCRTNHSTNLSGPGYLLLGIQEYRSEKFDTAEKFFSQASLRPSPIEDYTNYYLACSLYKLNRLDEAQKKLAWFLANFPDSPLIDKARSLYWETSIKLSAGQAVLDSLKNLSNLEENPEALFYQAEAYHLLEQDHQAVSVFQKLYYFFPLYEKTPEAEKDLLVILRTQTDIKFDIPVDWRIRRIEKLLGAKRYRDALKGLETLFEMGTQFSDNPQYQVWKGVAQFGSGRYNDSVQTLKNLNSPAPESAAQAWFTIAECYRKLDNYSQFKQSVEWMEHESKQSLWFEKALFSIGNHNLVKRNLEESMAYYRRVVDLFPNGSHVKDCHWRISWREYRLKNYQRALDMFVEHVSRFPDSEHRLSSVYWAGRCLENLGRPAEAGQIYQSIIQKFPNQYYGQLAKKQTAVLQSPSKISFLPDAQIEKLFSRLENPSLKQKIDVTQLRRTSLENWPRVKALALVQLFDLAAKELGNRLAYGSSPEVEFLAAQYLYWHKDFFQATFKLRRVFPNYFELPFQALPQDIWEMFYPANFTPTIFREARRQNVDPYLMMALIRQESAFDPKARSVANAHGLMQLLPVTARKVARGMKLARPSVTRLQDPDLNIRLGTRYFAELLDRFGGQEEKALASYNAGEHRVDSWMSEENYADSAEFVETIPFSETRNYVKIIYRNYWFYKTLYNEKIGREEKG